MKTSRTTWRDSVPRRGVALAAVAIAAAALTSLAQAFSFGGNGLIAYRGPIGAEAANLSCLGATPESIIDLRYAGEVGNTIDSLGRGHATFNGHVAFELSAPDPLAAEEPGDLLYRGLQPVRFSALIEEWPPEGFVTTPFSTVTFEVRNPGTDARHEITVDLIGYFVQEGGMGLAFGTPRCST